jgi:capsular exopolysaccharide synthesis family protein
LIAAIGIAFLLERLQPKIHFTDDVENIVGLPVIGMIPKGSGTGVFNSGSPAEEAFRTLRMNVIALNGTAKPLKRLLITSAAPNEGKSTIVANLAASLANTGKRVVVVDGDLRIPTIHKIFKAPNAIGLSTVLEGVASLDDALQQTKVENLTLLSSGLAVEKPAELLASTKMNEVLDELDRRFDLVVVDSPALLGLSDSLALARDATGVLLVARKSKTRRDQFESAHKGLVGVHAKPLGVIVNGVEPAGGYYRYYRGSRRRR